MSDDLRADAGGLDADSKWTELPPLPESRWNDIRAMGIFATVAEAATDPSAAGNVTAFAVAGTGHALFGWAQGLLPAGAKDAYDDPHAADQKKLRGYKLRSARRKRILADLMLYLAVVIGVGGTALCAVFSAWVPLAALVVAVPGPALIACQRLTKSAEAIESAAHESDQKAIARTSAALDLELKRVAVAERVTSLDMRRQQFQAKPHDATQRSRSE